MKLSYLTLIILSGICFYLECVLSLHLSMSQKPVTKVVITGASNSEGLAVFKKLLKKKSYYPIALVRNKKGYNALMKLGADPNQVKIFDICNKETLTEDLFEGATKAVLCTSSHPKKTFTCTIKDFFRKITFRQEKPRNGTDFYYPDGQSPYDIDYIGQRHVIDACANAKIEQIVMLGSMGGYRGGSKQNEIGRSPGDDPKKGNILKWKRAAERYLMKRSFFTIVHAGTLTDEPGGQREIVWDTDGESDLPMNAHVFILCF